jgi:plasmid stabilization system protein ParE
LVERPYLVLYRILPNAVQIVRLLHGARRIDSALYGEELE